MLSMLRKRFTYANAAMTLALVFAMTGGAYAAKHYLITSTKQISPAVLKQLKGAKGPIGDNGAQGPQGLPGPAGKDGANGKDGAPGESVSINSIPTKVAACKEQGGTEFKVAKTTALACNGQTGYTKTLPSGETEKGTWSTAGAATAAKQFQTAPISFVIPLATAPALVQLVRAPTEEEEEKGVFPTAPKGCIGNVTEPGAEKGNLCVFERRYENLEKYFATYSFLNPEGVEFGFFETAGKSGTVFVNQSAAAGPFFAMGTWAVTAK
jgi:hypothetical protein